MKTEERWWNACMNPPEMLDFLIKNGGFSDRKIRLLGCQCCRRIWKLLFDDRSQKAVEAAEAYADGTLVESALERCGEEAFQAIESVREVANAVEFTVVARAVEFAAIAAAITLDRNPLEGSARLVDAVARAYREIAPVQGPGMWEEQATQCNILRDILGPRPLRPPSFTDPTWLSWNCGVIKHLAEAAYQERALPSGELDKDRLAVLADALEEVGADAPLLEHLRSPGPHVRGCFVIDMLTGRK